MAQELAYTPLNHSLPIPRMYPQTSPSTDSSDSANSSINTTPSSGFIQPWLNAPKTTSPNTDANGTSSLPTPPTSMMQQPMNMMHPIYMYSNPYLQYPPNMMYNPYSSMFQQQQAPASQQPASHSVTEHSPESNKTIPASLPTQEDSIPSKDLTKTPLFNPIASIPQVNSYSYLSTTPVHHQLPRSDRRSSLSSEGSSSPSDISANKTDVSVDVHSDSELSRTNDSGNSSLGSDLSTSISPQPQPLTVIAPKPVEKAPVPAKVTPEPLYKKKARTNYTPEQVRGLEKVFLETPYPEPEAMEQMSKDLEIPEQKLKVWFQNKRARWRRRVQDNKHTLAAAVPQVYMPHMMSPYGFMAPGMAPAMTPAMTPAMAPGMAQAMAGNPMMGSLYPYQQAAQGFSNPALQKYGLPYMY